MNEPMKHKMTEAIEGQTTGAETGGHLTPEPKGHGSTPGEVAEDTRREQDARSHGVPDRDQYLTNIGRGQQTHG